MLWRTVLYMIERWLICIALAILWLAYRQGLAVQARDLGQYNNTQPNVREWFRSQKSPSTGALCCSEADGIYAEEEIRGNQYWTRWPGYDWQPVPPDTVLPSNPNGSPVVWWYVENEQTKIRCYAPVGGF